MIPTTRKAAQELAAEISQLKKGNIKRERREADEIESSQGSLLGIRDLRHYTVSATRAEAHLREHGDKVWGDHETRYLVTNWNNLTTQQIAAALGFTKATVLNQARLNGLSMSPTKPRTKTKKKKVKDNGRK